MYEMMGVFICYILCALCFFQDKAHGQAYIAVEAPGNAEVIRGSVTSTSLWITWDPVPKADTYTITITPPTISAGGIGSGIEDTNSIITGLDPNTEYLIRIRAVQGDIIGNPAVLSQFTALPSPTNVWAVEDSVTQDSMTIQWNEVEGAQTYTVEVRPSTGVGGGGRGLYATQARLRGMSANTLYTINIYPVNWVGVGAKATVNQYTKLPPPRDLTVVVAIVSPNSIGVQWSEVSGSENYFIKITPANSNNRALPRITDTRYIFRQLEPDTQYKIEVAAVNSAGPSQFTSTVQKTKSMCFAVVDDFRDDTFSLVCPPRCERFENRVFGTREYTSDSFICAAAIHDGRINSNVGGTVIVKKRPGLLDFVGTYNHGITSKDYENWHRSYVFALQTPENVQVEASSIAYDRFTVTWNKVNGAAAYRVTVDPPQGVEGIDSNIEGTRVTLTGLRSNTTYRVYVSAVNRVETSNGATILQATALDAPQSVQVLGNTVSYDSFVVVWDAMGVGANVLYQITFLANDRISLRDETTLTRYLAKNLTSGTEYQISVRAMNAVGFGKTTRITQYTMLRTPSSISVRSVTSRSMDVEWRTVQGAENFRITVMPINRTLIVRGLHVIINDLQPDTMYEVGVIAQNENERSAITSVSQITSLPSPQVEVVPGSLTHNSVMLQWNRLRNASYSVTVQYTPAGEEPEEVARESTDETLFTVKGLVERRPYLITVVGIGGAGRGDNSSVQITTLIMPPEDLKVYSDGLRSTFAFLSWNQIEGITQYYLSCEPSEGIQGLGFINDLVAPMSGFQFNTTYMVRIMGIKGKNIGSNATAGFSVILPSPKLVLVHSITQSSAIIQWEPKKFKISTISYNTSSINRISLRIPDDNQGRLQLQNLRTNTYYQLNVFSNLLSQLMGQEGVQKPIVSETILTGSNSNVTDVSIFWPQIQSNAPVNYLISTSPTSAFRKTNISANLMMMKRIRSGSYAVSVTAENSQRKVRSNPSILQFSQGGDEVLFAPGEIDFETDQGLEIPDGTLTNDKGDDDTYVPIQNYDDDDFNSPTEGEPAKENTEIFNSMWITIVVIAAILILVLLLIIIPCLCLCGRKQPMLRNYGFCGCCYDYYV